MWATRRRTIILLLISAFIALFVVLPYWLIHREVPSCVDNKQNQGEEGVDCGGPCANLCKGAAKDITVLWTKVFAVRPGAYDIVSYNENPNFDVGAPSIAYTAKLYDASGAVIAEREGTTFAASNERFAIFEGGMLTGNKVPTGGSIEITPGYQWVTVDRPQKLFSVTDKVLVGSDKKPKLTATLHNEQPEIIRNIDVMAIIYDSKGEAVGVSDTKVERLDGNGNENIFFTWSLPFNYVAETEKCEMPVDVVLEIDRSGSMREENKLEQAKQAAVQFVSRLTPGDQGAYLSFATDASKPIDQTLTGEVDRLTRAINRTVIGSNGIQFTNIGAAINGAINEFASLRRNTDARPVIVLLTDGAPTRPVDPSNEHKDYPEEYTRLAADNAKKQEINIYTIGLGSDVNKKLLQEIATSPEYYYQAASGGELSAIYQQIASAICKKGPSVIEIIPRVNNVTPTPPTH